MIRKLCYELYKIDWENSHMITKDRKMDSIKNYYEDLVGSDEEYTYNDYLEEFGYDGELYVCFEEFLESEYRDKEYIAHLLDNDNLFAIYCKDTKKEIKEIINDLATDIVNILEAAGFDDVTDSSGYFIIKEYNDGTDRAVDVYKSTDGGNPHYVIYCSYENDDSDWFYTEDLSISNLVKVLLEVIDE